MIPHEEYLDAWGYAENQTISPSPHGPSDLNIQEDNLSYSDLIIQHNLLECHELHLASVI